MLEESKVTQISVVVVAVLPMLVFAVLSALPDLSVSAPVAMAQSCEYWVAPAPDGDNGNPGTLDSPWATIEHAGANVPDDGCTVWIKDGVYYGRNEIDRRFSMPTTFKAENAYKVLLEFTGPVIKINGGRNIIIEGLELRHANQFSDDYVVIADRQNDDWSEYITFRNNIFHDAYTNDLLKLHNGVRFATVEGNIFYNQGLTDQHIDINSVTDIVIQDNILFNSFAASDRPDLQATKHFIVIKDSNEYSDGQEGSERITVRRNVFLNWEGGLETFTKVGNDGKPYHEAKDVLFENNLMIGNTSNMIDAAFGVRGAKNVTFANNTVVGDLPSKAFAFRVSISGENPPNENITFVNNIWSDPTGTMGAAAQSDGNRFSNGLDEETENLVLDNNLYWNGGDSIPDGTLVSPLTDDENRTVANPLINTDQSDIVLPLWNGTTFLSGNSSIRQEFQRLVGTYGQIASNSPAIGRSDPAYAPVEDILNRPRIGGADLGAYENAMTLGGRADETTIWLNWLYSDSSSAVNDFSILYSTGTDVREISGIPADARAYTLTDVVRHSVYRVKVYARDASGATLAESNEFVVLTTDEHTFLPQVAK